MTDVDTTEIEQLMAGLSGKIAEGHAAQSCDAAYAVYLELEALREQFAPKPDVNRTRTKAGVEKALEQASQKGLATV